MKKLSFSPLNIKSSFYTLLIVIISCSSIHGQFGIKLNTPDAYEGYTLCTAESEFVTYLINNCGEVINSWDSTFPRHYCRLTDEGNLIYISGNTIIERDWNNNAVRTISPNSTDLLLDYEVMKLKNGNYLAVARRIKNNSFFDQIGWDPNTAKPGRVDGIVEMDVNGNIVWEWNIGDHTIQDRISSVQNFGTIKEHPELVDVNAISDYDWQTGESFMINGMDYNEELDQIVVSVRKVSEFMIIDHSTTTAEAKGSTGGNSGKGGDILYRWGNPQNYDQGTSSDRILYFQHNPNWIKYGEHKGKIIMYNNGLTRFVPGHGDISSVHIVNTSVDASGNYSLQPGQAYEPATPDVTIDAPTTGTDFYSGYTSGAQVLPNGNIYITVGAASEFMEVKTDGTMAWEYDLKFGGYIFRTEQYAPDFPGFEGKDLTPNGTVEFPSSTYNCELFTSTNELSEIDFFDFVFDHASSIITIKNLDPIDNILEVRNLQGQLIEAMQDVNIGTQIILNNLNSGMYFISLIDTQKNIISTKKLFIN